MDALTDDVLGLAVPFIAEHEGFRSRPYQDSGGTWTIGYGFTFLPNGHAVTAQTPEMDEQAAFARLTSMVTAVATKVQGIVHRELAPHQMAALVSFAYNLGTGALRSSHLLQFVEAGNFEAAADQFRCWVYAGGRVVDGLVNRRAAERAMFLGETPTVAPKSTTPAIDPADALNDAELSKLGA